MISKLVENDFEVFNQLLSSVFPSIKTDANQASCDEKLESAILTKNRIRYIHERATTTYVVMPLACEDSRCTGYCNMCQAIRI